MKSTAWWEAKTKLIVALEQNLKIEYVWVSDEFPDVSKNGWYLIPQGQVAHGDKHAHSGPFESTEAAAASVTKDACWFCDRSLSPDKAHRVDDLIFCNETCSLGWYHYEIAREIQVDQRAGLYLKKTANTTDLNEVAIRALLGG